MSVIETENKVNGLRELRRMADELSQQIAAIEEELKDEMLARDTDTLTGSNYKITWKLVKSSRFDSKSFKAAYAELYSAFCKPSESRRFVVA